jgi:glycine betaine/proline transport system substrate-binding protein
MRAVEAKEWIVFLGWSPHPMNKKINLQYLKDGDQFFGANFGGANVFINTRRGLSQECPSLGMFLKNLEFNLAEVNELMEMVMDGLSPDQAAAQWILNNRTRVEVWAQPLSNGNRASDEALLFSARGEDEEGRGSGSGRLGSWLQQGSLSLIKVFDQSTRGAAYWTNNHLQKSVDIVCGLPPGATIGALALLAWYLRRKWQTVVFTIAASCLVWALGYWKEAWETLTLVLVASFVALGFGIPMGILAAKSSRFYRWIRPLLDMMQTLPTFVYLIPTLMLFGLGMTSGLVATVVFVLPVSIRLSFLGFDSVPEDLKELGQSFGAGFFQTLWKIEIPHAWPALRAAVSQSLMLSLSMVVVAALVGAEGLGRPVVQALNTVNLAKGIEAGLAIVAIAMTLDRLFHTSEGISAHNKV